MYASNCFAKGTGKTLMRTVVLKFPNFLNEVDRNLKAKLMSLPGIGPKKSDAFIQGLNAFKVFISDFPEVIENNKHIHLEQNKKIKGKEFVLTSIDDDNFEDYILDNGGILGKLVTENTSMVITGNALELTQKTRDAFELNVKVLTIAEFESLVKKE